QDENALRLCEWRLQRHPDDEAMVDGYGALVQRRKLFDRAERFLRAGLARRPVAVRWHRVYQSLRADRKRDQRLIGDYDAMLKAEPENSALLYLRGRLSEDPAEGTQFFERACKADEGNPWPLFALGYDRENAGDWKGARELY